MIENNIGLQNRFCKRELKSHFFFALSDSLAGWKCEMDHGACSIPPCVRLSAERVRVHVPNNQTNPADFNPPG